MKDWYIFKEKDNSDKMEYLGYIGHLVSMKDKKKEFDRIYEINKESNSTIWAMKVIKGVR